MQLYNSKPLKKHNFMEGWETMLIQFFLRLQYYWESSINFAWSTGEGCVTKACASYIPEILDIHSDLQWGEGLVGNS